MTLEPHALVAVLLSACALVLFSRNEIPLEHSCIGLLVALVLIFEFFPLQGSVDVSAATFLSGFGNEALITICLLLVLAKGVEVSGALHEIGKQLSRLWLRNRHVALLATLVFAAVASAFANNTPIVIMLLPILVGVAHRAEAPPSKILMPAGFATIIGGMGTTIGTSTNLLIVSVSEDYGLPRLQMFDFVVPAAIAAAFGILYLWLVAPRILPVRPSLLEGTAPRVFDAIVELPGHSDFADKPLRDAFRALGQDARIVRVERGRGIELVRLPTLLLQAGDKVQVRGTPEAVHNARRLLTGADRKDKLVREPDDRVVEVVVTRDSPLHGKNLSEAQKTELLGLSPIGWNRPGVHNSPALERVRDPRLRNGDVLLMQGPRQQINKLINTPQIMILARTIQVPRSGHARFTLLTMIGVVLVAALDILPIMASALLGVGMMLARRCITWLEAWSAIDFRVVLLIVTSLALGTTLTVTGAAEALAVGLVALIEHLPPPVVVSSILLITALLTEIVTNNAIAVIATPIAMSIATQLGIPPLPLVLAVLFGANMSYLTPIGYQTNLLVMGAGGYRFSDFFRVGLPLQLILWLVLSFVLSRMYL